MGRAADPAGPATTILHATCIAVGARGVLLRGRSGAGKSDLALRCLGLGATFLTPHAPRLVADDRVVLRRESSRVIASAPAAIAGRLEVRGLGIVAVASVDEAAVGLVIDLTDKDKIERMPATLATVDVLGLALPVLPLWPFEVSAALKVVLAMDIYGVAATP